MKHEDYPALYQAASQLSENAQKHFYRALRFHILLLVVASVISVANSTHQDLAILQALVLLGTLGCAIYLYLGRPDRHWYAGRAVAESIKTSTWRFVSRAEPFNNSDEIDNQNFGLKQKAIVEQNRDIAGLLTTHLDGLPISSVMGRLRNSSDSERLDYYRKFRIVDQQNWYAKKASFNRRMVNGYFIALLVTLTVAIALSIAKVRQIFLSRSQQVS